MKRSTIVAIALMGLLGSSRAACAARMPAEAPFLRLKGSVNCPYIPAGGGRVYLQVSMEAGELMRHDRRPLNVALVLDRSGSMAAEGKIENAKAALRAVIDQLRSDDILSIVIYDDEVDVLRQAGRVGNKQDVRRLVDEIQPRGWTNLGGGMVEGFRQARRNASERYVNRVLLLSDGLANRGVTDPGELSRIAAHERQHGVSLTTVGVGLEYNENLMLALSERGGGNYYFLESARDLASVLRNEFSKACGVLAQNAVIDIDLGLHIRVVDVVGCAFRTEGARVSLEVGDVYGGERREWTVVLDVPAGEGSRPLAKGNIRFQHAPEASVGERAVTFASEVRYSKETAVIERHRDNEIQAKGDIAVSTREVELALKALDEGRKEEAMQRIDAARQNVAASPAAVGSGASAEMLRDQESRLKTYNDRVKDADEKKAKKEVQYDNYRTQKQK